MDCDRILIDSNPMDSEGFPMDSEGFPIYSEGFPMDSERFPMKGPKSDDSSTLLHLRGLNVTTVSHFRALKS